MRDLLAISGLGLTGYGLYEWYAPLSYVYAGGLLVVLAMLLEWRRRRRIDELNKRGG